MADTPPALHQASPLHLTPESIARATRAMLGEILERLEAKTGSVHATAAVSHIRLCCRLLREKVGPPGHAPLIEIETAAPVLYGKRTAEERRVALRERIRQLCATLQPVES
jgi:hypothetical protein